MKTFDQFKNDWWGKSIDYDHVNQMQCVDLILQYVRECYGIVGGVSGHAINYWTTTPAALLMKFHQESNNRAQKGDIVILWGLTGNPYGHIGIATGNINDTQLEILEQNGLGTGTGTGRDAIGTRWVNRSRIAGLLRPNAPTPTAPVVPLAPPYKIIDTYPTGRNLKLNKDAPMYNLGLRDFDAITANPVGRGVTGYPFVAKALLHHDTGRDYFLPDPDNPVGFNVHDCDDYIPTPPPPPLPPSAPVDLPSAYAPYRVFTALVTYPTASSASKDINGRGVLKEGGYLVYRKDDATGMLCLVKERGGESYWINPALNVEPPPPVIPPRIVEAVTTAAELIPEDVTISIPQDVVEKPKPNYYWIRTDREPVRYRSLNTTDIVLKDLENPDGIRGSLPAHSERNYSMWTIVNKVEYYILTRSLEQGYHHAIARSMLNIPDANVKRTSALDYNGDDRVDISDIVAMGQDFIDYGGRMFKSGVAVVATAARSVKVKRFIDGIKKRDKV